MNGDTAQRRLPKIGRAVSILDFRVAAVAQAAGEVANARRAAHALANVATRILKVDKALAGRDLMLCQSAT
jgi:hypothetical protein